MRLLARIVALILGVLPAVAAAESPAWPALPSQGFIRGRPATRADVAAGNALFVAAIGEKVIGRALEMQIPQYAYYNDGGRKVRVVVVQAEEAEGKKIVGARAVDGTPIVGFVADFELLGNALPRR